MIPGSEFPQQKILVITAMFFVFVCLKKQKYTNLYLAALASWPYQVGNSQLCATPLPPQPVTTLITGSSNNANTRTIIINIVL